MPRTLKRFPFALVARIDRNEPWSHISYHTTYNRAIARARHEQNESDSLEFAIVVRAGVKYDADTFPTATLSA